MRRATDWAGAGTWEYWATAPPTWRTPLRASVLPACTGGALEVLNTTIAQPAVWIDRHGPAPAPNGTQHETD